MTRNISDVSTLCRIAGIKEEKFRKESLKNRMLLVIYYNRDGMSAREIADLLNAPIVEVEKILRESL